MISQKTAILAVNKAKYARDPFGAAHPFNMLSQEDQSIVREWFRSHAIGMATLNSVVYAVAHNKLDELTQR